MLNKVEILAPAGSVGSLQASFKAGADAVYVGGSKFGARAYADNPGDEDLIRALDYAHMRGKKVYLTVNTLVKETEMDMLAEYIGKVYEHGVDAVIVQDLGVLNYIGKNYPDLPIHISTQGAVTNHLAANHYPENVTRIVPARELTIEEIAKLKKETGKEIEVFVHGALCYSYSGNCLFSSMCGDRSGNRGRCAQPCRLKTDIRLQNGTSISNKYLLSPKDICTIDNIPELVKAGIDSFKIEGRMKSTEYAAYMSYAYKYALDLYYDKGEEGFYRFIKDNKEEWNDLKTGMADLYNRGGFTKGYAFTSTGPDMMSVDKPNHHGTVVGKGIIRNGFVNITLDKKLYKGDVIELVSDKKSEYFSYTTPVEYTPDSLISFRAVKKEKEKYHNNESVVAVRMRCNSLLEEIADKYINPADKIDISAALYASPGSEMVLTLTCEIGTGGEKRIIITSVSDGVVSEAKNAPTSEDSVKEKLLRTGDSEFEIKDCLVELAGNCFIPKSFIGNIRRLAIDKLKEEIADSFKREHTVSVDISEDTQTYDNMGEQVDKAYESILSAANGMVPEVCLSDRPAGLNCKIKASVYNYDQLAACVSGGVKDIIIDCDSESFNKLDLEAFREAKQAGCSLYIKSRRIADDNNINRFENLLDKCASVFDGAYVKNLSYIDIMTRYFDKIYADKWLYVCNSNATEYLKSQGILGFVYSPEISHKEMSLIDSNGLQKELEVYGAEELMISRQCMKKTTGNCNHNPEFLKLGNELSKDRSFTNYQMCSQCRNIIFDDEVLDLSNRQVEIEALGVDSLIISFVKEGKDEVTKVLKSFAEFGQENIGKADEKCDYYNGHFIRSVL